MNRLMVLMLAVTSCLLTNQASASQLWTHSTMQTHGGIPILSGTVNDGSRIVLTIFCPYTDRPCIFTPFDQWMTPMRFVTRVHKGIGWLETYDLIVRDPLQIEILIYAPTWKLISPGTYELSLDAYAP